MEMIFIVTVIPNLCGLFWHILVLDWYLTLLGQCEKGRDI